jgi:hypothetical protein
MLPQAIVAGLSTTADKIRALDTAGLPRAEIARFLGIRYQHVRNTLIQGGARSRLRLNALVNTGEGLLRNCTYASGDEAKDEHRLGICIGFIKGVGITQAITEPIAMCPPEGFNNGMLRKAVVSRLRTLPRSFLSEPSAPPVIEAVKSAFPC